MILHLDLRALQGDWVELRCFTDNPNIYEDRRLNLTEIGTFITQAETDYYTRHPVDFVVTGRSLFDWLDGEERWLTGFLETHRRDEMVLAIAARGRLAHLPWEVLHDGTDFLVAKTPAVVPVRWVGTKSHLTLVDQPENRALNLLFMATAPEGEQSLDFEKEEGMILEATKRQPLSLTVEESGCLEELGYLLDDLGGRHFDVFHLTGHATIAEKPIFVTESETGEKVYSTATDLVQALGTPLPRVLFVSGCKTGKAGNGGAVPSLAEELLGLGAEMVLGWGQNVLDPDATLAAAAIYQKLAVGKSPVEALGFAFRELIGAKARDWHLLRLYVADRLLGGLVTAPATRGRKKAPVVSVATRFLDPAGQQIKVPARENFVGRRRVLQRGLRALKTDCLGLVIHGMGGLGKSSLAARFCDRLRHLKPVILMGALDEARLVKVLAEVVTDRELRTYLQDPGEELRHRLRQVLEADLGQDLLVVLDDFEENLEGDQRLKPEARRVLADLVGALDSLDVVADHRVIITCRYDFVLRELRDWVRLPLDGFAGADLAKKCRRLEGFKEIATVIGGSPSVPLKKGEVLGERALGLADGNPRLLEWLDKVLTAEGLDRGQVLDRLAALEADQAELRELVLAESLLAQVDGEMARFLGRGKVYDLPVPREAMVVLAREVGSPLTPLWKGGAGMIERAVSLGLLEVSPDGGLRVPRIVPVAVAEAEREMLAKTGAECLYGLWWESGNCSEIQALEILRLALLGMLQDMALKIGMLTSNFFMEAGFYSKSLSICDNILEYFENHAILNQKGLIHDVKGQPILARKTLNKALSICPDNDIDFKNAIICNLCSTIRNYDEYDIASVRLQKLAKFYNKRKNPAFESAILHQLGSLLIEYGKKQEGLLKLERSIKLAKKSNNQKIIACALTDKARVLIDEKEFQNAQLLLEDAQDIFKIINSTNNYYTTLHELGRVYLGLGELDLALVNFQKCLDYSLAENLTIKAAYSMHEIAFVFLSIGKLDDSLEMLKKVEEIESNVNRKSLLETYMTMATIHMKKGDIKKTYEFCSKSLSIAQEFNDKNKAQQISLLQKLLYAYL